MDQGKTRVGRNVVPIYEYRCRECSHKCEFLQGINEGAKRKCPNCGKLRLQKQISTGTGLVFKGPGFYATDYKKDRGGD